MGDGWGRSLADAVVLYDDAKLIEVVVATLEQASVRLLVAEETMTDP